MTALNIDHKEGKISATSDGIVQIAQNSGVIIGDGTYLDEYGDISEIEPLSKYKGCMRFNKSTNTLQYCNGSIWVDFETTRIDNVDTSIVWAILF